MKVLLVNGSPHKDGCTYTALEEVAKTLNTEGIDTKIFQLGKKPLAGCIACNTCSTKKNGRCGFSDKVNDFLEIAGGYDGYIFGSPVHYAAADGAITSFMDRAFRASSSGEKIFYLKPAAAVVSARRAGTTAALDQLNKYFTISEMPVISSKYWTWFTAQRRKMCAKMKRRRAADDLQRAVTGVDHDQTHSVGSLDGPDLVDARHDDVLEAFAQSSTPSTTRPRSSRIGVNSSAVSGRSTNSRNHESEIFTRTASRNERRSRSARACRQSGDASEHSDRYRIRRRIRSTPRRRYPLLEHRGIQHATTTKFDPAGVRARATSFAATDGAGDLELRRGLGEGEVARTQPRLDIGAEVSAGESLDDAREVREGDAPIDDQALDLMEGGEVARVGRVAPVAASRHDRVDRQRSRCATALSIRWTCVGEVCVRSTTVSGSPRST